MTSRRGVVLNVPMKRVGDRLEVKATGLDPYEVRWGLILFDQIEWPRNQAGMFGSHQELISLIDTGIITRTDVTAEVGGRDANMFTALMKSHVAVFDKLAAQEPGVWTLAASIGGEPLGPKDFDDQQGIRLDLTKAIPIPDREVPFHDVLEFKEKHRSELLALRMHIDEIYLRVINAGDGPIAWNMEITRFGQSVDAAVKLARESKFPWKMIDLKGNMSLSESMFGVAKGLLAGQMLGNAILGALGATASLGLSNGYKRRFNELKPFQYLIRVHNDLLC